MTAPDEQEAAHERSAITKAGDLTISAVPKGLGPDQPHFAVASALPQSFLCLQERRSVSLVIASALTGFGFRRPRAPRAGSSLLETQNHLSQLSGRFVWVV